MRKTWETPRLQAFGSVAELTKQQFNKVGAAADIYTGQSPVVGSLVPISGGGTG